MIVCAACVHGLHGRVLCKYMSRGHHTPYVHEEVHPTPDCYVAARRLEVVQRTTTVHDSSSRLA